MQEAGVPQVHHALTGHAFSSRLAQGLGKRRVFKAPDTGLDAAWLPPYSLRRMISAKQRPLFNLRAIGQHADAMLACRRLFHAQLATKLDAVHRCRIGHAKALGLPLLCRLAAAADDNGPQKTYGGSGQGLFHGPNIANGSGLTDPAKCKKPCVRGQRLQKYQPREILALLHGPSRPKCQNRGLQCSKESV